MMMEIDLHGLELWEALEEIVYKFWYKSRCA